VQLVALGRQRTLPWHEVSAAVRDVAYAPDGETMGFVCADGGAWLYSARRDLWVYTRDHETDASTALFSPDGKSFMSADRQGRVVARDVTTTFYNTIH
jgi:WD40 repeat protein